MAYTNPEPAVMMAFAQACRSPAIASGEHVGSCDIAIARNHVATKFLAGDCDCLVMVDHDCAWPKGCVDDLAKGALETRGIVGAIIPQGNGLVAFHGGDQDAILNMGRPALVPVDGIGTGMIAIHRSVLALLAEGMEETVIQGRFEVYPFFDRIYVRQGDDQKKRQLGEDYSFSKRCRDAGVPIHAFTGPEIGHWKKKRLTWRDALREGAQVETPSASA